MTLKPLSPHHVTLNRIEGQCGLPVNCVSESCLVKGGWNQPLLSNLDSVADGDKQRLNLCLPGRPPMCVNESGLYDLILSNRQPAAKAFRRWVTGEVLPTIRKTGRYMTPKVAEEAVEQPEVFLARALVLAHEAINGLKVQAKGWNRLALRILLCGLRKTHNFPPDRQFCDLQQATRVTSSSRSGGFFFACSLLIQISGLMPEHLFFPMYSMESK